MNYKELFHRAFQLISSPASAWEEIRLEEDRQRVFTTFVYPLIGFCGLSVFIGALFEYGWAGPASFQKAMTDCCSIAVSLFGGYYLASYLINLMRVRFFGMDDDHLLVQQFSGYAMVVLFLLGILMGLFSDFTIVSLLLQFYTVYIVWEGCSIVLQVEEKERFRFTIYASLLLIGCPFIIQTLFDKLMVTLN